MFEHTRYPLTDWFKGITLILNAKQGVSAMEIMRNMDCSYKTAWYLAMGVRCAIIEQEITLKNIAEMDESYVGGKPRKVTKMLTKASLRFRVLATNGDGEQRKHP